MAIFGNRLRELREAQHLTRDELGRRLGVTGTTIYRYEHGERDPAIERIEQLAAELRVEPGEFFAESPLAGAR
jgi:transcriptional regulator with XRE-family HTH domain